MYLSYSPPNSILYPCILSHPRGTLAEAREHMRHPPCSCSRTPAHPSPAQSQTLSESFIWNWQTMHFIVPVPLTRYDATHCLMVTVHVHYWYFNSRDRFSVTIGRGEELMLSLMDQETLSCDYHSLGWQKNINNRASWSSVLNNFGFHLAQP